MVSCVRPMWSVGVMAAPVVGEWVGEKATVGDGENEGDPFTCAEFALSCKADSSTTSKSEPGMALSAWRSSLFQRLSDVPEMYQLLPLSATNMP